MGPIFSVVSTAKNERDRKFLEETFENWELAKQLFEEEFGKGIEFIVVDAGGNVFDQTIKGISIVEQKNYEEYRRSLCKSGLIKNFSWDSPSIGRNLGFKYAEGRIVVFHDIDTLFSTGIEEDYKYVCEHDEYRNYFEVMYEAFKKKNVVGAAPSLRPLETKKVGRRFGVMGLNCTVWLSTKLCTAKVKNLLIGPSVAGCSFAVRRDVASSLLNEKRRLYDPELAIAEDYKFSREIGMYGKISYEKRAGAFMRTARVGFGHDILKSLLFALKWAPYYICPDFWKYHEYSLSVR